LSQYAGTDSATTVPTVDVLSVLQDGYPCWVSRGSPKKIGPKQQHLNGKVSCSSNECGATQVPQVQKSQVALV